MPPPLPRTPGTVHAPGLVHRPGTILTPGTVHGGGVALPSVPEPFTTLTRDFGAGDVHIGNRPELDGITQFSFACWFRRDTAGWLANQTLMSRNASGNRALILITASRGASGELRIGIGNGSSLFNAFFPDNTFDGPWYRHVAFTYNAGTLAGYADGAPVTLINVDPSIPTSLPTVNQELFFGASDVGANPWPDEIHGPTFWLNRVLTDAEVLAAWAEGVGADMRSAPGVPTPTWFLPLNQDPIAEVQAGLTVTVNGSVPTSSEIPRRRAYETPQHLRRVMILDGGEPEIQGTQYSASPSAVFLSGTEVLMAYSRGTDHTDDHVGYTIRSRDGGTTWPIGTRNWPQNSPAEVETAIPHGSLTEATSRKRGFTLSLVPGIGAGGADRVFLIFTESGISTGLERRVWVMYSDDGGSTWSTPYNPPLNGTLWASVGRARIAVRTDGSLIAPYYYRDSGEGRYTAAVMRSTDDGVTWAHFAIIAQDPLVAGGARYEEPYFQFIDGDLVCLVRVDSGIQGSETLERDILRTVSSDEGSTWPTPVKVFDGYGTPSYVYRDADGLMMAMTRVDTATVGDAGPLVLFSNDVGVSWSTPVPVPFELIDTQPQSDARWMQGDHLVAPDGRIVTCHAQDHESLTITRMWWVEWREENWNRFEPPPT